MSSSLHIDPHWRAALDHHGLVDVDSMLAWESGVVIERESSSEVRRVLITDHRETEHVLYLKKYFVKNWKTFRNGFFQGTFFGSSKARREFGNLKRLRQCGIDAPEPVAYGEERRFGGLKQSFLVTEAVPESMNLDDFLLDKLPTLPLELVETKRKSLVKKLADLTRTMHEKGFIHRDYFSRNVLVSGGAFDQLFVLDAPKGRWWPRWLARRKGEADLAALDSSAAVLFRRAERIRFYMYYCRIDRLTPAHKSAIRRILQLADPQRARQTRRLALVQAAKAEVKNDSMQVCG